MTLRQILQQTANTLSDSSIEDAHLEAAVLLSHTLNLSPTQLYAQPERELNLREINGLHQLIERRLHREPAAYIVEHREFYGIDFFVDSRALIPRPETEHIVDEAIKYTRGHEDYSPRSDNRFTIADIGTGCGAIAISLASHLPQAIIYAADISPSALEIAQINCQYHGVTEQVILLQGNLLEPLPEPANLVVANLPYIRDPELPYLDPEIINFEPLIALAGGQNGLEKIYQLLDQARRKLQSPCCLILEIGQGRDKEVSSFVHRCLPESRVELIPDLSGIKRVIKVNF